MSSKSVNSYWREIVAIIEGGLKPDAHRVSSFSGHFAQALEDDGDLRLAHRIRRLINGASKPAGSTFTGQALPADVESQQSLVEQFAPSGPPEYPVLPKSADSELQRFVQLNKRSGDLAAAGLNPPSTLLLFGPPGCGKTMAAIAIACDLALPLFVVRLDSLLGSFLGNSAKNLRRVFDNAFSRPCVLLLDEFDVIGKMRDDEHEVGEIKRLVGSLLQNLDRLQGMQIVIAATNHHHMLDAAVWRRFDVTLHLQKPGRVEIASIILRLTARDSLSKHEVAAIATLSDGFSGSDITRVIERALQDKFLYPDEPFTKLVILGILSQTYGTDEPPLHAKNIKGLLLAINQQSGGNLPIRQIARLIGCSHTYAHEVIRASKKGSYDGE